MKKYLCVLLCAALLLGCACAAPKKIVIASKPHTEQYILAEMLALLVETHTDIQVEKKLGIGGGTNNIHPAMLKGEIDAYAEYSNTGWLVVLKNEPFKGTHDELYAALKAQYLERFGFVWLDMYGFDDSYALVVRQDTADQYGLKTVGDLAKVSDQLTFGANYDFFEINGGYNELAAAYGFKFKKTVDLDIGLKYQSLEQKQTDVINGFTTDAALGKYSFVTLEDDLRFFPVYYAATLVRQDTLKKYPELERVFNMLKGQISAKEMIAMNEAVEIDLQDARDVAEKFLKDKGLI